MRLVDWKLYTSAALGAIMGVFGVFAAATKDLIPILAVGTFLVLYVAFMLLEFVYEQVKTRA